MSSATTAGMKPLIGQPIAPHAPTPTDTSSQMSQSEDASTLNQPPPEGTFGSKDRADQRVGGVSEKKLQRAIDRLETHIDRGCALVRTELSQELRQESQQLRQDFQREVDQLDGKIDALGKSMTTQFRSLTTRMFETQGDNSKLESRIDGLEKTMNKRFSDLDTRLETRFSNLESDVRTILNLLQHRSPQGIPSHAVPLVVAHPPSSEGHGTDNAPGPSSPRGRQTLSPKSSNISLASASKARELAHTICRSASKLMRKLPRAKKDEDGAGQSE